ncbi:tRNA pseudouridine synthase A [uncultured Bifidobacterium sp.]|uniref:tRNA pseudouridine synthase A n=1 Tax=uncultured Bifidobacterium sp. TaxID=165187 RepID=UPI0028DC0589|nr:tRNA pseudouridine synthase A [uncultured Bifidobacterium sp.]
MRLRIDLAYDGSDFHGWARQPGMTTVQGSIEDALTRVLRIGDGEPRPRLVVAGRTDAGVHASHQVCHVDVDPDVLGRCVGHIAADPPTALLRRLDHLLPSSVRIRSVAPAPDGFDARFSALARTYVYRLGDGVVDPRLRGFVLAVDGPVDVDAMNEACGFMVGLHDFGSFAIANPGGTTIRRVLAAGWSRVPVPDGTALAAGSQTDVGDPLPVPSVEAGLLRFTIIADAFARNMVRSLVGACLKVGRHDRTPEWMAGKITVPLREGFTGPAPAFGLTLESVSYPPDEELAARARAIRARRTLRES